MTCDIFAIVLAAGESSRFGSPKALAELGGHTVIEELLEKIRAAGMDGAIVVLGNDATSILPPLSSSDCKVVINAEPSEGQLSSLKCALEVIPESCEGAALFLIDHPWVRVKTLRLLCSQFQKQPDRVIRPVRNGRGGHPTLFPLALRSDILDLSITATSREVFLQSGRNLDIPVEDEGVIAGFNTRAELETWSRHFEALDHS